ncbi:diaminopimelate dehydrogenase [Succinispira mobilis]|uniref:diaminopimelate dehydrogenase n=1 Tax=Succinispira mobilis TaxID=78120 RepID=UPI00035F752C|nr:diaminopimelate dehydrogenase [Succinispira mobilis]
MTKKFNVAIVGYGNVGRGAEQALLNTPDMELVAVISRRTNIAVASKVPVLSFNDVLNWQDKIDVLLLCGGSATDLIEQTPFFTRYFNTVDSFDTHARIPEHFANVDNVAKANGKTSIISVGWDPGLFSLNRVIAESILPNGQDYTFWGPGVSQGHSDAIRRIPGVIDAKQYTLPVESVINEIRSGHCPKLSTREKHHRDCYVVAEENADLEYIAKTIKEMPNYFSDYDTTVNFLDQATFNLEHNRMPHGGFVFRSGSTSSEHRHVIEFCLKLDSNPEFTASAMVAYARAAYRQNAAGNHGALTVFDIPPKDISLFGNEFLRKNHL